MKKIATSLPGLLLLEPRVFGDDRGFFLESYNQRTFAELGIPEPFVRNRGARACWDGVMQPSANVFAFYSLQLSTSLRPVQHPNSGAQQADWVGDNLFSFSNFSFDTE